MMSRENKELQLKCVSDTIPNWFEHHQPQKPKISTVTNAPFIQNLNQMASRLTSRLASRLVLFLSQRPSFSAHRAALMTKTDLSFIHFTVQFCFCQKFSFHDERCSTTLESGFTVAWFSWTNQNSLLCIVTNEIASFCIDNRLRQMAFLCACQSGERWAKAGFRAILKDLEIKKLSLLSKTNRFHVAVRLFSNRSQKMSKYSKNINDTIGYRLACQKYSRNKVFLNVLTFLLRRLLHQFMTSCMSVVMI